MPSPMHEGILELLRDRPSLVSELLETRLGVSLPRATDLAVANASLADFPAIEWRADLAIEHRKHGKLVALTVVEVQLAVDAEKPWSWPLYVAAMEARHRCPAYLVVVAPKARVAAWAREIGNRERPCLSFRPLVLGPAELGRALGAQEVERTPELALLAVLALRDGPQAIAIAEHLLAHTSSLDEGRARLYFDLMLAWLAPAARATLEAIMSSGTYQYQSDFARKYVAIGRSEGEAKGKAEGEAKGKAEGEAKGRADAILAFLAARKIAVSAEQRARITACSDLTALERWIGRMGDISAAEELFEQ